VRQNGGSDKNAGPPLPGAAASGAVAEAEFIDADGTVRAVKPLLVRGVRAGSTGAGVCVVSGAAEPAGLVVVR
jgi:hypothetical protein